MQIRNLTMADHHQAGILVSADRPRRQPQSTLVLNSLVMKLCYDRRDLYIPHPRQSLQLPRAGQHRPQSRGPVEAVGVGAGGPARLQEAADGDPPANADAEGGAAGGADHRQGGLLLHVSSLFFAHL